MPRRGRLANVLTCTSEGIVAGLCFAGLCFALSSSDANASQLNMTRWPAGVRHHRAPAPGPGALPLFGPGMGPHPAPAPAPARYHWG